MNTLEEIIEKNEETFEKTVFDFTVNVLTQKNIEIYQKDICFDKKEQKYLWHVKYFGNSTVDICFNYNNKKPKISFFLDNNYNEDEGCPECYEIDKKKCEKECKELLIFLKQHKIPYCFDSE
ncbi:MAG: hypothetical protein WC934_06250 [Acidithiobacillus sp.]|jgi:hypothetical protein|uniref:hypothetical protein n=1 Tax=Acidithiobacillus sp. TaxID=1872118 RepID=UPI00355F9A53